MKSEKFIKLKKQLSNTVIICMIFQIFPTSLISANKVFAATGFRHVTLAGGEVALGGNYIEVGISKSGSFGTENPAPSGFHPTNGGVGLRVDGDGYDVGNEPTTGDFFLPGNPEESFTIGYKVGSNTSIATNYTNAERITGTDIATVTTDTTTGDILSALTSGTTIDNNLTIQQKISFKVNDKYFKNTVTYTNKGTNTLYDVRYMRSFDPDQDSNLHGEYSTYNSVLENFPQDKRAIVRAAGGFTKEPVFFISTDNRARASTFGFLNRDPYDTNAYNDDGSKLKKSETLVDQAIALTFALGDLSPGQSTTFEYYTCLDPDYNSGLGAIMSDLGLKINNGAAKTNSLDVTLNLSGKNATEMQFSNDNSTWSSWENYDSTKLWTLTAGTGMKTVYANLKDSSGNISTLSSSIEYAPDTTAPTLSVSGNPTTWINSDVTLVVSASDTDSGLNTSGAYSFDGGSTWSTSNTKSFSENKTVNIKVRDNSGNITSQNIVIDKIDKSEPTFSSITKTPTDWTSDSVTITVNGATDNAGSGLNGTAYSFSTTQGVYSWQSSNVSTNFSQNQAVYVYIRDAAGNVSKASTENITNIDKTLPIITSVTGNPSDWTKESVTLVVNASDTASGLAEKAYSFDGGQTWQESNKNIYDNNTDGILIKVKDNTGNIATYSAINISKIYKTEPNTAVISNKDKYTENKWFNETETITASFTKTPGTDEKLQYKVNDSAWTDGEAVDINTEGKYSVNYRVIDSLGRASEVQTVKVNLDKTAPTNAKITVKDKEFTSFLNTITFGLFFKETVNVAITADSNISGENKIEYQKVSRAEDYDPDGTWTEGSSLSVQPDEKFIVYGKITDNAGNYVIINTDGVVIDSIKPAIELTQDSNGWTKNNVNIKVKVSDNLAGLKEVNYTTNEATPHSGTVEISNGEGNITLTNEGNYTLTVTAKDNSLNEISESANIKIDKTLPTITSVTGNPSDWTKENVTLVVNASDATSGPAEKAYSFDGGQTWQESNEKIYDNNTDGILIKVKDNTGNIATYNSINISKIDKTEPNTAVISNKDKYTENKWFNETETITASFTKTPGTDEKLQYKVNDSAWTDGEAVDINTEGKYSVNYRVIDSLGRTSEVQTVKVNLDKTAPTNAKITVKDKEFTSFLNTITFGLFFKETVDVAITADSNISGENKIEYQKVSKAEDYDLAGTWTEGNSLSVQPDEKFVVYGKITDNAGNYVIINTDGVVVDSIKPVITGASNSLSYFVGRVINFNDTFGEVNGATYKNVTNNETSFNDGDLFEEPGKYTLIVKDKAGNSSELSFEIKALPKVEEVVYTKECKELIDKIRAEFETHGDLPESYKTDMDNKIKALESRYSELDKEVIRIKTETKNLEDKVEKLPNRIDGLISKESTVKGLLSDIEKSTKEQQSILKSQTDSLNNLLNTINVLLEEVKTLREMINSLPELDKITIKDSDKINTIFGLYSKLTNEQKELLGEVLIKKLNDSMSTLSKLMLHDIATDVSVVGIDGTTFTTDVYLIVTPIKEDNNGDKFSRAAKTVEDASKYIPGLEGKELLSLYDVSLFKNNIKIQPDGKVKVKIRIPEELKNRTGFDIVHIADNGTVTPMNATVEGEYLVFITTHFSEYAIVAKELEKEMPKTGGILDLRLLTISAIILMFIGIVLIKKQTRKN